MKPHECIDCIKEGLTTRPRQIKWTSPGGRIKRCGEHHRVERKRVKHNNHTAYAARTYGISRQEQAELWAYQSMRCPCGRRPTRMPDTDHDHYLARQHDHEENKACPECMRGLCCRACNKDVLGRYNSTQLRALADYLDDPPYQRMRRLSEHG